MPGKLVVRSKPIIPSDRLSAISQAFFVFYLGFDAKRRPQAHCRYIQTRFVMIGEQFFDFDQFRFR
jgi:hypothetical protein